VLAGVIFDAIALSSKHDLRMGTANTIPAKSAHIYDDCFETPDQVQRQYTKICQQEILRQ